MSIMHCPFFVANSTYYTVVLVLVSISHLVVPSLAHLSVLVGLLFVSLSQIYGVRTRARAVNIFDTCTGMLAMMNELQKVTMFFRNIVIVIVIIFLY